MCLVGEVMSCLGRFYCIVWTEWWSEDEIGVYGTIGRVLTTYTRRFAHYTYSDDTFPHAFEDTLMSNAADTTSRLPTADLEHSWYERPATVGPDVHGSTNQEKICKLTYTDSHTVIQISVEAYRFAYGAFVRCPSIRRFCVRGLSAGLWTRADAEDLRRRRSERRTTRRVDGCQWGHEGVRRRHRTKARAQREDSAYLREGVREISGSAYR